MSRDFCNFVSEKPKPPRGRNLTTMSPNTLKGKNKSLALLGHIGAIIAVVAWGLSFISTKALMGEGHFTPVEMFTYRFAAAYVVLFIITINKGPFSHPWRDELRFAICGICAGSLYFIVENFALRLTSAANVSMLASISPLFTIALVAVIYKTRITGGIIIGSIVAFVGVAFVILSNGQGLEIHPTGDLLALCAALSWAIYSLVVKPLLPLYNGFYISRKLFFYGVLTSIPLLLMQPEASHLPLLWDFAQPKYILNFAFLVLICSVAAYVIWNEAMKIIGSVTTNNYLYGQPIVTMIAAAIWLGEGITWMGCLGCLLIIVGLIITDHLPALKSKRS